MLTKSDNTSGNPYHDEEGKFASKDGANKNLSSTNDSKHENSAKVQIKLKEGKDVDSILSVLQQQVNNPAIVLGKVDTSTPLIMPNDINEAEMQGNKIIGSKNAVGYSSLTDVKVAFEFNKALFSVCKDFPKLFENDQLYLYGTSDKRQYDTDKVKLRNEEKALISSILKSPVYVDKLNKLGLNENDIMDTMTYELHQAKKSFGDKMSDSVGGFTCMADYDRKNHTINAYNVIKFNPSHSQYLDRWENYSRSAIKKGHFFPTGNKTTAYMVGVHELGHHVFEKLVDLMDANEIKELRNIMHKEASNMNSLHNLGEISGYATTSRHEHMAECFADVYCREKNATQHNKNVFNFLKNIYERKFNS